MRRPTGGDVNRRSLNLHHGVLVSDDFRNNDYDNAAYNAVYHAVDHAD